MRQPANVTEVSPGEWECRVAGFGVVGEGSSREEAVNDALTQAAEMSGAAFEGFDLED